MPRIHLIFSILLGLLLLGLPSAAPRAEAPRDLASLLPANTLVAIDIPDLPALMDKWESSAFCRFYQDPRTAGFFRAVRDQADGFQRRMGLTTDQLRDFFSGQCVVAGVATGSSKEPLEWVVLARHNGNAQVLGRFQRPPAPPGTTMRRIPDKYKNFDIVRFEILGEEGAAIPTSAKPRKKKRKDNNMLTLSAADLGQSAPRAQPELMLKKQTTEEMEACFDGSLLIYAGSRNHPLHRILDQMASATERSPLSRQPEFRQARQAAGAGDLTVYASVGRLAAIALGGGKANAVFNPAGLAPEDFKAAALAVSLQPGRATLDGALLAPEPRYGISRALFLPASPKADPAALIPAGANACSSINIDLPKLWNVLLETLRVVSPPAYALAEAQFRSFEQGTGLKVEKDLAGQLGGQVASFHLAPDPARPADAPETFMIALRDGAAFRDALKAMLDFSTLIGGYHIVIDKAGPWPLWTLVAGIPGTSTAAGEHPLLYLCVTDHWLLAGTRRAGIDAVAARLGNPSGPSLEDKAFYKATTGQLPAGRFAGAVIESGGFYRLTAALLGLRESELLPDSTTKLGAEEWKKLGLKSSRMPDPAVWQEYFGPAGGALSRGGEGVIRLHAVFTQRGSQ